MMRDQQRDWLFLRFFDESADRKVSELGTVPVAALMTFHIAFIACMTAGIFSNPSTYYTAATLFGVAIMVVNGLNGRTGNALNMMIPTLMTTLFMLRYNNA